MNNAFARALLTATLEDYTAVSPEENIVFSSAFEKKMEKLCRNADRRIFHPVKTAFRRAILIAALLAALAVTAFAVPSIRNTILGFFVHNAGTHYEITFSPEQAAAAPKQIETFYRPHFIPNNFSLQQKPIITPGTCIYIWVSRTNDYISFAQYVIQSGESTSGPNAEGVTTQTTEVNGNQVFCIYDDGAVLYFWTDCDYYYELTCGPSLTEWERNKIFHSIRPDPTISLPTQAP